MGASLQGRWAHSRGTGSLLATVLTRLLPLLVLFHPAVAFPSSEPGRSLNLDRLEELLFRGDADRVVNQIDDWFHDLSESDGSVSRERDVMTALVMRGRALECMGKLPRSMADRVRAYQVACRLRDGGVALDLLLQLESVAFRAGRPRQAVEFRRRAEQLAHRFGRTEARETSDVVLPPTWRTQETQAPPLPRSGRKVQRFQRAPTPRLTAAVLAAPAMTPGLGADGGLRTLPAVRDRIVGLQFTPTRPESAQPPPDPTHAFSSLPMKSVEKDYRTIQKALTYYRGALKFGETLGDPKAIALFYADLAFLKKQRGALMDQAFYVVKSVALFKGLGAIMMFDVAGVAMDLEILSASKALGDMIRRVFREPAAALEKEVERRTPDVGAP